MIELSPLEALELIDHNRDSTNFTILDVRTPEEYHEGHLRGAVLQPYGPEFSASLAELSKDNTYLVYCRSGGRSLSAGREMEKQGFSKVFMLAEGMNGWVHKGMPVEN